MATTLRYKNEVRNEKDYFDDIENIKVPADMLKLATISSRPRKGISTQTNSRIAMRTR